MGRNTIFFLVLFIVFFSMEGFSQQDTTATFRDSANIARIDSVNIALLESYNKRLLEIEKQRVADSIRKVELNEEISSLKTTDNLKKEELQAQLLFISENESIRLRNKRARIDSLKNTTQGYAVTGFFGDSLFRLYSKLGSFSPKERAEAVKRKIEDLGDDINFNENSLKVVNAETTIDIVMDQLILMSVTETDALWNDMSREELAKKYRDILTSAILKYKEET